MRASGTTNNCTEIISSSVDSSTESISSSSTESISSSTASIFELQEAPRRPQESSKGGKLGCHVAPVVGPAFEVNSSALLTPAEDVVERPYR